MRVAAGCVPLHVGRVADLSPLLPGSSPQKQLHDIAVTFFASHRHGRPAIQILHIDVSALIEQEAYSGRLTFIGGYHQCCPAIAMSCVDLSAIGN